MEKQDYHYSITIHCKDKAVLYCLRALSMYAQDKGDRYKPWGGTGKEEWERNDKKVTFRFTRGAYRQKFIDEAKRILRAGSFQEVDRKNEDPPPLAEKDFKKRLKEMGL